MAHDLVVQGRQARDLISSPGLRQLRRISLGTVQWPGEPTRKYLPAGLKLTDEQREAAERTICELAVIVDGGDPGDETKARHVLVSDMLMVYPQAGSSLEAGRARGSAYREALSDVSAWAVKAVIARWHRGECGDQNYHWAPAPATLRELCLIEMAPFRDAILHIEQLLAAKPLEEVMRPAAGALMKAAE